MVHLQHHVRKIVLADHHRSPPGQIRRQRTKVQRLVRLHDAARGAFGIPHQQVHRAEACDRRAAHRRDAPGQRRQRVRRQLVNGRCRLGHPGGRRLRVPELQAALVGVEIGAAQGDGRATRKLQPRQGRRRPGCGGLMSRPRTVPGPSARLDPAFGLDVNFASSVPGPLDVLSRANHARMLSRYCPVLRCCPAGRTPGATSSG